MNPYAFPKPGDERRTLRQHVQLYQPIGDLPKETTRCDEPQWKKFVHHPNGERMPDGSYICPDCGTRSREAVGHG